MMGTDAANGRSTPAFYVHGLLVQPALNRISSGLVGGDVTNPDVIQIEPKIMDVLLCLADRQGEVLSKDEIIEAVWPDVVVTDDVLSRAISELRKIFDDDPRNPVVIETIRKRGYRLIADVHDTSGVEPTTSPGGRHVALWYAVAGIIILMLILLIVQPFRADGTDADRLKPVPLTSFAGQEITPALSPDGQYVAMAWNGAAEDNWDIYVQEVGSASPKRLTDDPADEGGPAWSPDGRSVAFIRHSDEACGIFVVSVIGGPERRIGACRDAAYADLVWSPDGQWLAFNDAVGTDRAHRIVLMDAETGLTRPISNPPESIWGDFDPAFSPESDRVAFARAVSEGLQELYIVEIDGGPAARVLAEGRNLYGIAWSSNDVIYSSNTDGTYDLWRIPAAGGRPDLVLAGEQHLVNPSVAAGRLAYELRSYDTDMRRFDVASGADAGAVSPSTRWEMYPAFSPDGERLAFISNRSGSYELWVSDADGSRAMRLTSFDGPLVSTPRWSPDGGSIAFDARPRGQSDVVVIGADGGQPVSLVTDAANDAAPFWSSDGRMLYFGSDRSGRWEIWRVAARGGGEAVQVTRSGGFTGLISENDSTLFFVKQGEAGLRRMPVSGGASSVVLADLDPGDWGNWDVVDGDVYFVHRADSVAVRRRSLASGDEEHVFTLPRITPTHDIGLAVSPDAAFLIYPTITRREADVMMVDGIR